MKTSLSPSLGFSKKIVSCFSFFILNDVDMSEATPPPFHLPGISAPLRLSLAPSGCFLCWKPFETRGSPQELYVEGRAWGADLVASRWPYHHPLLCLPERNAA